GRHDPGRRIAHAHGLQHHRHVYLLARPLGLRRVPIPPQQLSRGCRRRTAHPRSKPRLDRLARRLAHDHLPILAHQRRRLPPPSPTTGKAPVGLPPEPSIPLPDTIAPPTVTSANVFASFAGAQLPVYLRPTPDGKNIRLFYDPPLPPSARIRVTIVGDPIRDD